MKDSQVRTREYLDGLAEQIANFSLRIDLATQAMLTYLREFDSHDGWAGSGFVSTSTWLAWRIEISPRMSALRGRSVDCMTSTRHSLPGKSAIQRFVHHAGRHARDRAGLSRPCDACHGRADRACGRGLSAYSRRSFAAELGNAPVCSPHRDSQWDGADRCPVAARASQCGLGGDGRGAERGRERFRGGAARGGGRPERPGGGARGCVGERGSGVSRTRPASNFGIRLRTTAARRWVSRAWLWPEVSSSCPPHRGVGGGWEDCAIESGAPVPQPPRARARGPAVRRRVRREDRVQECLRSDDTRRTAAPRRPGNDGPLAVRGPHPPGRRVRRFARSTRASSRC